MKLRQNKKDSITVLLVGCALAFIATIVVWLRDRAIQADSAQQLAHLVVERDGSKVCEEVTQWIFRTASPSRPYKVDLNAQWQRLHSLMLKQGAGSKEINGVLETAQKNSSGTPWSVRPARVGDKRVWIIGRVVGVTDMALFSTANLTAEQYRKEQLDLDIMVISATPPYSLLAKDNY